MKITLLPGQPNLVHRELPKPGPYRGLSTAEGSAEAGACQLKEQTFPATIPAGSVPGRCTFWSQILKVPCGL